MTDYLYAKPNFLGGMTHVLDLGATLIIYNDSPSPREADQRAMKSDWIAVGKDIMEAKKKFIRHHGSQKEK